MKDTESYKTLQKLEGLADIKRQVEDLIKMTADNYQRELRDERPNGVILNAVFVGNPGTGKTTVAKLYGQILCELGLLSKGDLISKTASDFKGDVVGSSEKTTRDILRAAEGCVLLIDEAYTLFKAGGAGTGAGGASDPYGLAVIDTLVEQVQARPGDDRAVILMGYKAEMNAMFQNVNPGLRRRFQREFDFPDYDDQSLLRILINKVAQANLAMEPSLAKHVVRYLAKQRAKPHFGNAGAIDQLLSGAQTRLGARGGRGFETADFAELTKEAERHQGLDSLLDDVVGMPAVRGKLQELRDLLAFVKEQGTPPADVVSFNYLFLGPPGTGKTTIARKMGLLFHGLGLLATSEVHEISASDLTTGFVGQAGKATRDALQKARGSVLFIDEAYQLNPARGGSYMTEAVDELVKCLTSDEFRGKLVVVLAGYEQDMKDMLGTNAGLASRFPEEWLFENIEPDVFLQICEQKLTTAYRVQVKLSGTHRAELLKSARRVMALKNFGNGRDAVTWARLVFTGLARRKAKAGEPAQFKDLLDALQEHTKTLEGRQATGGPESVPPILPQAMAMANAHAAPPPRLATATATAKVQVEVEEELETEAAPAAASEPNPFDGVDSAVLARLQKYLDQEGLNNEAGSTELASMREDDPRFGKILRLLRTELRLSPDAARDQLRKWQQARMTVKQMAQKLKHGKMRPIWRCGVCGRADKPWIACYVAPYIVRYERINE